MSRGPESEARRALARLRRAAEKGVREVAAVRGALMRVEAEDFPAAEYERAEAALREVIDLTEAEGARLQEKLLTAGGLEPGRVRRTGG